MIFVRFSDEKITFVYIVSISNYYKLSKVEDIRAFMRETFVTIYRAKGIKMILILIDHFWHLGQKCVPLPPTFIFLIVELHTWHGVFYSP